jgi:hypothetical protein
MCQQSLLSEVPALLLRLPDSGTTVDGRLYALPTPERLTAGRDGSASLPTPCASGEGAQRDLVERRRKKQQMQLGDVLREMEMVGLLPTPTTVDAKVFGPNIDWQLRLTNHAPHTASVLMNLPSDDGNEPSDDQHPIQQTIEGCYPDLSNGWWDYRKTMSAASAYPEPLNSKC